MKKKKKFLLNILLKQNLKENKNKNKKQRMRKPRGG